MSESNTIKDIPKNSGANRKIEKANDNDDTVVSMVDILQEEEALEDEYNAVLGGSDEKCCTYSKGYVNRQALYACLTCTPEAKTDPGKRAGVCLACCYNCHENHDLIELYTKRNFRCDCGSSKIPNARCSLEPVKESPNDLNLYNQNFSGLYCVCHRPYPDPDDPVEDTMIQCVICEDWYHGRHLDATLPSNFSEMICKDCMQKNEFLKFYSGLMIEGKIDENLNESMNGETNIINESVNVGDISDDSGNKSINKTESTNDHNDQPTYKKIKLDCVCKKPTLSNYTSGGTFWSDDWRTHLCKCPECMNMYKTLKVEYLLDNEDTVKIYEEKGKNSGATSSYERGMKALSSLDRMQQVDAITGYNQMKDKLKEFLQEFVNNRQVVTEDDIKRFFDLINKEKPSVGSVPHFCR